MTQPTTPKGTITRNRFLHPPIQPQPRWEQISFDTQQLARCFSPVGVNAASLTSRSLTHNTETIKITDAIRGLKKIIDNICLFLPKQAFEKTIHRNLTVIKQNLHTILTSNHPLNLITTERKIVKIRDNILDILKQLDVKTMDVLLNQKDFLTTPFCENFIPLLQFYRDLSYVIALVDEESKTHERIMNPELQTLTLGLSSTLNTLIGLKEFGVIDHILYCNIKSPWLFLHLRIITTFFLSMNHHFDNAYEMIHSGQNLPIETVQMLTLVTYLFKKDFDKAAPILDNLSNEHFKAFLSYIDDLYFFLSPEQCKKIKMELFDITIQCLFNKKKIDLALEFMSRDYYDMNIIDYAVDYLTPLLDPSKNNEELVKKIINWAFDNNYGQATKSNRIIKRLLELKKIDVAEKFANGFPIYSLAQVQALQLIVQYFVEIKEFDEAKRITRQIPTTFRKSLFL